jgi:hypothetical protein
MTIASSGQLSIADLKTEFGGDASNISLQDYYAGGTYVSAGTAGDGGPIPSSGEIKLSDFYGAPAAVVTVSGELITHFTTGATATAGVRVNTDGTIDKLVGAVYTQIDASTDWIIPNIEASSTYEVRITNVSWTQGSSFDTEASPAEVWISMAANREWSIVDATSTGLGAKSLTFDIEIRYDGGAVLDAGSFSMSADYEVDV